MFIRRFLKLQLKNCSLRRSAADARPLVITQGWRHYSTTSTVLCDLKHVSTVVSRSEHATRELGRQIALHCKRGDVVCLVGDMGSGKTILAQGFVRGVTCDDEAHVTSPTFLLDLTYDASLPHIKGTTVHHIDLYRVDEEVISESTLYRLDIPNIFAQDICLIEWGDKLGQANRPQENYLELRFRYDTTEMFRDHEDTSDEHETRTIEIYATEPNRWKEMLSDASNEHHNNQTQ